MELPALTKKQIEAWIADMEALKYRKSFGTLREFRPDENDELVECRCALGYLADQVEPNRLAWGDPVMGEEYKMYDLTTGEYLVDYSQFHQLLKVRPDRSGSVLTDQIYHINDLLVGDDGAPGRTRFDDVIAFVKQEILPYAAD